MQDSSSSSNDGATAVLLPLFLCSLIINAGQHFFHSNRMEMLKSASDLYDQKFQQQEQTIAQLQRDKAAAEAKLAGYIQGRR